MARRRKKARRKTRHQFERGVSRAQPQTIGVYKSPRHASIISRRDVRPQAVAIQVSKPKVYVSKVHPSTRIQTKTRPIHSLSSPMACKQKKAHARREYFGMRAAGKGGSRLNKRSNRFTVRC